MNISNRQFLQRAALAVAVFIMVACSWLPSLDMAANKQVDAGFNRALISFATARTLNAMISAAQGTEIAAEPAGVGLVFTPGQLLDPVNDLVEQFSNLMLAASVAFGIQKMLISIGAATMISLVLSITALTWAFIYLRQKTSTAWLSRILVVLLMIRFAVPVVTIGSEMIFHNFLETEYQSSQQVIDATSSDLGKLNSSAQAPNKTPGMIESFKERLSQITSVKPHVEHLKQLAEQSTKNIINLMAIFVLQTLIIPLLLLWVLYRAVRRTLEPA